MAARKLLATNANAALAESLRERPSRDVEPIFVAPPGIEITERELGEDLPVLGVILYRVEGEPTGEDFVPDFAAAEIERELDVEGVPRAR